MFNLRKETIKKNIFLILSNISAFIVNGSPIKLIVPPLLVFAVSFILYRKSKNTIKANTK